MANTSGTLGKAVSSVASPAVNYSFSYTATRTSEDNKSITVSLGLEAWLNSSLSSLKSGIKLTAFARLGSGPWVSTVLKQPSAIWQGVNHHTGSISLSGDVLSDKVKIEIYVSRSGSTYSGLAGALGSASNPKSYTANLPAYSAPSEPEPEYQAFVRDSGSHVSADCYADETDAIPYANKNGVWELL